MPDDVLWSDIAPGDITPGINVANVEDAPGMLIMHAGGPDWVRDPETGKPVRIDCTIALTDLFCRNCSQTIKGPVSVMFYASVTRKRLWSTNPCPHCHKWVHWLMPPTATTEREP
jgi:hypothetical protein